MTLPQRIKMFNSFMKSPGLTESDTLDALSAIGTPADVLQKRAKLAQLCAQIDSPAPTPRRDLTIEAKRAKLLSLAQALNNAPTTRSKTAAPSPRNVTTDRPKKAVQDDSPIPMPRETIADVAREAADGFQAARTRLQEGR